MSKAELIQMLLKIKRLHIVIFKYKKREIRAAVDLRREARSLERRKSTVFYHKVTAILILFQLAIAICELF